MEGWETKEDNGRQGRVGRQEKMSEGTEIERILGKGKRTEDNGRGLKRMERTEGN